MDQTKRELRQQKREIKRAGASVAAALLKLGTRRVPRGGTGQPRSISDGTVPRN